METRRSQGLCQLFDYKPIGRNRDWSNAYRNHLALILEAAGFVPGKRPTAYGFRHTFIDVLKKAELPEFQVAELVGHANRSMTFGHYGKKTPIRTLQKAVNTFQIRQGGDE